MASLHSVELKPLQTHFYSLLLPAGQSCVLCANCMLTDPPACSNLIGRNKDEAEGSEMLRSLRFEVVCHQTLSRLICEIRRMLMRLVKYCRDRLCSAFQVPSMHCVICYSVILFSPVQVLCMIVQC